MEPVDVGARWPLVGRERQLGRLVAAMCAAGGGRSVVVAGPAGVGKTRLLTEAMARAEAAGARVHAGVGSESIAGVPLGALAHVLPADAADASLAATVVRTAEHLSHGHPGPVCLVVDDAHLLDAASVALLGYLAAASRVTVVAAVRQEDGGAAPVVLPGAMRIEPAALDVDETARLLGSALGGPVESDLVARLAELTRGNPLLLRELVDVGRADGVLVRRDGLWCAAGPLVRPGHLPGLIAARLDRLGSRVRAAAELVALAEPVEAALLEDLLGPEMVADVEEQRLLTAIDDPRRASVRLVHPLYGEALRATVPPLRAREHHRRLAAALTGTGLRRRGDRLRAAVWTLRSGRRDRPELFLAAARDAARSLDHDLAGRLAQAAVDAGGGFTAEVALLGELAFQGRARESVRKAVALSAQAPDEPARLRVAQLRARAHLVLGEVDAAGAVLAEAAGAVRDPELLAWTRVHRAAQAYATGDVRGALELGAPVAAAPGTPLEVLAHLAGSRVRALASAGRPVEALGLADRVLGALGEGHRLSGEVRLTRLQALPFAGRAGEALAAAERAVVPGDDGAVRVFARLDLGHIALMTGDAERGRQCLRELLAQALPVDGLPATYQLWGYDGLAEAAALLGDARAAAAEVARLEAVLPRGFVALRRSGALWALAAAGDLTGAQQAGREHAARLAEVGAEFLRAWVLHDVVRLGPPPDVVADVAAELAQVAARCDGLLVPLFVRHAVASAARDAGGLDAVAAEFAALGYHLWGAEAAATAARLHRNAGRPGSALASTALAERLRGRCVGVRTPALDQPSTPALLTPREREVAGLAARGMSDRDIATQLRVSVRTVHSHLHRTYHKLGIGDRTELAALLHAGPGDRS